MTNRFLAPMFIFLGSLDSEPVLIHGSGDGVIHQAGNQVRLCGQGRRALWHDTQEAATDVVERERREAEKVCSTNLLLNANHTPIPLHPYIKTKNLYIDFSIKKMQSDIYI